MRSMRFNIKKSYTVLSISYIIVISVIIVRYFNLPQVFDNKELAYAEQIELKIDDALNHQYSERKVMLEEIAEEYAVDMVVYNNETKEEVIATVPYKNNPELVGRTTQDAVLLEAQRTVVFESEPMYVWYSIYHLTDYTLMADFYIEQSVAVMVSLMILIIFLFTLQKNLYDPLVSIKGSLDKMDNYELDSVSDSYDVINQRLHDFSVHLAKDIDLASVKQTELARSYELLTDRYQKNQTLLRSLIHDLKTPLLAMLIENQLMEDNQAQEILKVNDDNYHDLMKEINSILDLIKSDEINANNVKEFDLVTLLSSMMPRFSSSWQNKNLQLNIDTPDSIIIENDETSVRMLISNLLSNAINYSVDESELDISLEESGNRAILCVENQATEESIDRMLNSEMYFNTISNESDDYEFSNGSGLHLIKSLSEILKVEYNVTTTDHSVRVSIVFDKDVDAHE